LKARHSDLDIKINLIEFPGNESRVQILNALTSRTSADIVSVDQIWLGEFAEKGLLIDLINYTDKWGRQNEWYAVNWDGGAYNDKIYGIWAWTDLRGIWYWKDLLKEAGVEPESLKTWDGYIASARKLNATLKDKVTQGVHLSGVGTAVDMWYPYLWMLGGAILESRPAHPTKEFYWFPGYGVRASNFIKDQIDAEVKPRQGLIQYQLEL
jgi:multiple sugar transport system substrate-binding protein